MDSMHPLKRAIEKRGLTVNSAAEKAGVPVSNLYMVIRGRSKFENMGVGSVIKLAHALDTTADELVAEINYYHITMNEGDDDED